MKFPRPHPAGLLLAAATLLCLPLTAPAGAEEIDVSVFGSQVPSDNALIGILYDLKQDQSHKKLAMSIPVYNSVVDEFLSKGWDESVLNRYYRVTRPLYATQLFVPLVPANTAPKAFQVEKIVQPSFWMIHYKGQVSPPTDGTWRFWGWGEEVCSVAINGKPVLLANWKEITTPNVAWKSPEGPGQKAANGEIKAGTWFDLKKDDIVDLDVIIGERGGGVFCAFLLIEKKGETYEKVDGHPILPVFQLAPRNTPQPPSSKEGPRIAQKGPIWHATP